MRKTNNENLLLKYIIYRFYIAHEEHAIIHRLSAELLCTHETTTTTCLYTHTSHRASPLSVLIS